MSMKYCLFEYNYSLYKNGKNFLDICTIREIYVCTQQKQFFFSFSRKQFEMLKVAIYQRLDRVQRAVIWPNFVEITYYFHGNYMRWLLRVKCARVWRNFGFLICLSVWIDSNYKSVCFEKKKKNTIFPRMRNVF